ncbi:hypothetical protein BJV85_004031 [Clostridium acetobutylicum]|uniref:Uncharacterized protein n=1 Tax=Clostridium acetobutylicum (strain ATCC 824 / DSM 792 / JCM 1419 / IAM 19013 / LMG 5710 / NBRC 13948 / NRRL B-527 / VKM B-1787 / 2291 / W) TaxID=272562 RepID=Q97MH0_CLOAB|nr:MULTISPECIES: hypothetical protein [Clostridium]AAK78209.1 Hypothetical protein CA_C0228 [Clostridium acetobutylicum ATCC 824]ADZ19274.1 hypothetical protein CEA_G0233 [Clostridium acetobutylicum EA 2018]AEI31124.1 hypothetical protein SMB_G0233 [Clostridium acetobutylicum DSM 1731]AWV82017.1 hypothetical protein DK921_18440 [Clostridium acetobutylicum]MBC2395914.1 hypothetical protein [Clostridium acetobutylicum]
MKKKKIKVEEQAKLLLNEFKDIYEPKNKIIDEVILKGQNELNKDQIPQVVLKHVVSGIYQVVFIEKVTVGDKAYKILTQMDKLSRSNGYLPFGTLFNIRF